MASRDTPENCAPARTHVRSYEQHVNVSLSRGTTRPVTCLLVNPQLLEVTSRASATSTTYLPRLSSTGTFCSWSIRVHVLSIGAEEGTRSNFLSTHIHQSDMRLHRDRMQWRLLCVLLQIIIQFKDALRIHSQPKV